MRTTRRVKSTGPETSPRLWRALAQFDFLPAAALVMAAAIACLAEPDPSIGADGRPCVTVLRAGQSGKSSFDPTHAFPVAAGQFPRTCSAAAVRRNIGSQLVWRGPA
jgi:hypothetical protein